MNELDVSVIVPTYHRERELLEAINSVRGQRGVALEIIVVDDSPQGSAREAVASLNDSRIRYVRRPEPSNGRPAKVRNDGAALASGRFLYFLDDDDVLEADTLSELSRALDAVPQAGMSFGVIAPFGINEEIVRRNEKYFADARRIALKLRGPNQLSACLTFRPAILVCSAGMARREFFEAVGGFDTEIPICEDAELWARIASGRGHVFIDRTVVRYRTGAPSLMHNLAENDEKLDASYRRIQGKYRQAQGTLMFYAMKIWTRLILR
ncbi:MAG TPA: glycosyltransferase [Steroidobacteraceae bacterium]|nr:glycosyltransferase [Steroidobacteraceae bacterium]